MCHFYFLFFIIFLLFFYYFYIYIRMGRKKKYNTCEEKRIAVNENAMRYYLKNREKIKEKNRKRYHDAKNIKMED